MNSQGFFCPTNGAQGVNECIGILYHHFRHTGWRVGGGGFASDVGLDNATQRNESFMSNSLTFSFVNDAIRRFVALDFRNSHKRTLMICYCLSRAFSKATINSFGKLDSFKSKSKESKPHALSPTLEAALAIEPCFAINLLSIFLI